ncbi:MAG: CaiB/BaiF CoA transferase family protein [Solirubrobacterales bacterium]
MATIFEAKDGAPAVLLDLTRLGPGGYCTSTARSLGARVIKVEDPRLGDYAREVHMMPGVDAGPESPSAFFRMLSLGKESVALDLKSTAGRAAFLSLVERADVVVEQFRPGVMDRLGLGWAELHARNPRLVMCSITAFGQDSPFRDDAAHDINVMGLSGLLEAIAAGRRAGSTRQGPQIVGVQLGDAVAGLAALTAILGGLYARSNHGRGAWIDVSMYDALLSLPTVEAAEYAEAGRVARPGEGMLDGAYACYNLYRTGDDGWLAVGAFEEKFWKQFCTLLEQPEWIVLQRDLERQESLMREVAELIASRPLDEWLAVFAGSDCCVSPVRSFDAALEDEHARRRRLWKQSDGMEQPTPFTFADGFELLRGGVAPERGEHTGDILGELGVDPELIAQALADSAATSSS